MQQHYVKKTVQSSNVVFLKKTVSGANTFGLHMELPLGMLPLKSPLHLKSLILSESLDTLGVFPRTFL